MRIGLLADIHEAAENLRTALAAFARENVDAIIQLGDAIDLPRSGATATAALLARAGALGVWGNHDIGFCCDVLEETRKETAPHVLDYMAAMPARLELGGCHFSHIDPYLRPERDPIEFYLAPGPPDTAERAEPSFAAVPHRVCFIGHYHVWQVTSDLGPVAWDAREPLALDPARRHLVAVGPLVRGDFGVYDTDACLLTPFRC